MKFVLSTKGNISKLSSLLLSSLPQISSLKFRFTFWKASLCFYPVYFPLEIEVMCKRFIVEDVVEGETVSRAKIFYPRFDRLSPTAIPWLQRSVLEINRGGQYGSSGHKEKRAREKETRMPVLSFAHFFQAPVTQAKYEKASYTF